MRRAIRLLVALGLFALFAVVAMGSGPAGAASGPSPLGALQPGMSLLGQTPYVEQKGVFRMRLSVQAASPSTDLLQVLVFSRLGTRTDFDNALHGQYDGYAPYTVAVPVKSLPADRAGGVDVDIPVNEEAAADAPFAALPSDYLLDGSSVFPVQVSIVDGSGAMEGQPISTFLVYAAGPSSVTFQPALSVAVVLPFGAAPNVTKGPALGPLPGPEAEGLSQVAAALSAHPTVRVTVIATPQTLESMASGSPAEQLSVDELASLAQSGSLQPLQDTYVPTSISDLDSAGLSDEASAQLASGNRDLTSVLGVSPSQTTWATFGSLDTGTVSFLVGRGVNHFVGPDGDFTQLPAADTFATFASPTWLTDPGGPKLAAYGGDVGLTSDFASTEPPVLAADQLLAEMAMIQTEYPGTPRGVVAMPPAGWVANPTFVSTLIAGLDGNPLLAPVTVAKLFASLPAAAIVRGLSTPVASGNGDYLAGDSSLIANATQQVGALASSVQPGRPRTSVPTATLQEDLLVAESTGITETQRLALLGSILEQSQKILRQITLPGSSSITLTASDGQIPITILSSPSWQAHVLLKLSSQRLIFQPFNPPGGRCQVPTPTVEVCTLDLVSQNTTIKVPVQTRSSGVFPLQVELTTPDGFPLGPAHGDQDTVRSTAVSDVGVVLIILAVLSLAVWWIRDLRHGRRARRLVPSPVETADVPMPAAPGPDANNGNASKAHLAKRTRRYQRS